MSNFLGEFDCKLDIKGRMMLPANLKKQLPGVEDEGLVINRGFEKHLVLYTKKKWDEISEEINKLNDFEKSNRDFKRYFNRGASELPVDSSSRVLLPKNLMDYAGIVGNSDVTLVGRFDKIEIWDKATYDAQMDIEPEDFSRLAQQVMGNGAKKGGADE